MIAEKYGDYKLSSYDSVRVSLPDFDVDDVEVLGEMKRIASRHSSSVTVEPHTVGIEDMVQIRIRTVEQSGRMFPGLTHDIVDVQLGVGSLPDEIEVALLGKQVGETVEAEFEYTDYSAVSSGSDRSESGGCCGSPSSGGSTEPEVVQLRSTVEILAQRKLDIPQITDEWVEKNIGFSHTVADFERNTRKKLERKRRHEYANQVEYDVIEQMGSRLVGEIPSETVEMVENQLRKEFDNFLKQYDMALGAYLITQAQTEEDFLAQIRKDAHDRVAQDIALVSYARHFQIEVDDSEVNAMFSQPTPEKTYESRMQAESTGEIGPIRDLALRAKVVEQLTRAAEFVKPNGEPDKEFEKEIASKYEKIKAVRSHVTAAPMMRIPTLEELKRQ